MSEDFRFDEQELPLRATMPWAELGPVDHLSRTCRYCDRPVDRRAVVCAEHQGYYIQMRKKAKAQTARLVELAREPE